jgi:hypothetical protein
MEESYTVSDSLDRGKGAHSRFGAAGFVSQVTFFWARMFWGLDARRDFADDSKLDPLPKSFETDEYLRAMQTHWAAEM